MVLDQLAQAGAPGGPSRQPAGGRVLSRPMSRPFLYLKRGFDIAMSLLLLPALVVIAGLLCLLNPLFNRGPVFFLQRRMGQFCRPFTAIKFRSMRPDPVETDRITPLGHVLRRSRID